MLLPPISDQEFVQFQNLFYKLVGIHLAPTKKTLVSGRLAKRLRHYKLKNYSDYLKLLTSEHHPDELQIMVNLLTTNETYFFREPAHFDYLRQMIIPLWQNKKNLRIWSAACSSGEEAYSLAMVLMDALGEAIAWEVVATDVNIQMLEMAKAGQYLMEDAKDLPQHYLTQYCLKGVRSQQGTFLIDKKIRHRVHFHQVNLHQELPSFLGHFDLIFLRNTLIYFDLSTKQHIIRRLLSLLKDDGYFVIGHAESLMGVTDKLYSVAPTLYKKRQ